MSTATPSLSAVSFASSLAVITVVYDCFSLQEVVQWIWSQLATYAWLLVPTIWRIVEYGQVGIHVYLTTLHLFYNRVSLLLICGKYTSCQSVCAIVRNAYGFLELFISEHRGYRSKNLVFDKIHVLRAVSEYSWLNEEAFSFELISSAYEFSRRFFALLDETHNLV